MAASVTHFEIYAEDLPKLAGFYNELFGRQIDKAPGIDYFQIQTGTAEGAGIRGGMLHRPILGPRTWVHYVSVGSIDEAVEHVQRLGEKLVRAKAAVPKVAWYAVVEDPEGNIFAMWEADPLAFPPRGLTSVRGPESRARRAARSERAREPAARTTARRGLHLDRRCGCRSPRWRRRA